MSPERLLRIGALYHGVMGATLLLLPGDLLRSLEMQPPGVWLFYYGTAAAPALAGLLLEVARRRPDLRPGLCAAVGLGSLFAMVLTLGLVVWEDLPRVLLGPGFAAGLWAWLLWGVYSPESEDAS